MFCPYCLDPEPQTVTEIALHVVNERYLQELGWAALWAGQAREPQRALGRSQGTTLAMRKRWAREDHEFINANL